VVDELTAQGVTYELADGGATVMVPSAQVYNLRVALAGKGIPADDGGDNAGWSLLDKQGITATDFQQNVAYQRAIEGELAKTLQAIDGVNTAVVNIAVPAKDVFSDEEEKTTASVLLSLKPGDTMSNDQVLAITNLVAGSVTGLKTDQVTISDQAGNLLSSPAGTAGSQAGQASRADQQTAQYEDRLNAKAQALLDRVLGPGNSVVKVNAQLDFSTKDTVSEKYTQPSPAVSPLSQATVNEQYSGTGTAAGGTLGVVAPTALAANSGGGAYVRNQSTVNNGVDKTVERAQAAPGTVQRLTVSVVLNAKTAGTLNTAQVQSQIAAAVGLDPARGDTVQVDALPFDETAAKTAAAQLEAAAKAETTAKYTELGKQAGLGLLALIVLIVVMRRRKKAAAAAAALEATASDLPASGLVLPSAIGPGTDALAIAAGDQERERVRDDVAALVDNQPEEVARMLQGWLGERSR
jgi:flagellar M-ring protein FliF